MDSCDPAILYFFCYFKRILHSLQNDFWIFTSFKSLSSIRLALPFLHSYSQTSCISRSSLRFSIRLALKDNDTATQANQQRTIATFFSPITPTHATSQLRAIETGSQLGHWKGITIDWEIAIFHERMPQPHESQSHHLCHWQTQTIISPHHRCFPCFGDLSF